LDSDRVSRKNRPAYIFYHRTKIFSEKTNTLEKISYGKVKGKEHSRNIPETYQDEQKRPLQKICTIFSRHETRKNIFCTHSENFYTSMVAT
jgi:hypothetical protein